MELQSLFINPSVKEITEECYDRVIASVDSEAEFIRKVKLLGVEEWYKQFLDNNPNSHTVQSSCVLCAIIHAYFNK